MGTLRRKRIDETTGVFTFLILVWLLALLLALPVKGESRLSPDELATRIAESGQIWQGLSETEREQTRERFLRFLRLRPEDRNRAIDRYRRFHREPAALQEKTRDNYRRFAQLPEPERATRLEKLRARRK